MVDTIACFLTCGYTEAGAMQFFLRKINDKYVYKQFLPNKTRKRKGDSKQIDPEINGLTGQALLEKIYFILSKHREEILQCKAILIEDDLDGKFYNYSNEEIENYQKNIVNNVYEKLGVQVPVFILYASPEAESWFLADWKNGFEYLYCDSGIVDDLSKNTKLYFTHHLKQFIDMYILKEYMDDIEEYGWFDGEYVKLSDEIISAVQIGVKEYMQQLPGRNAAYLEQIIQSRKLYYSKKLHGDRMLRNIQPEVVAGKCRKHFADTCNQIKAF